MPVLDATGITVPRLADLLVQFSTEVEASPTLGPAWQAGAGAILSQIAKPILSRVSDGYEVLEQLVQSMDPDQAAGVHLDARCAEVGIVREPATYTLGTCQLTGVATTVVPVDTQLRVPDGPIVKTLAEVILTGGADDVACQALDIGEVDILASSVTEIVTPVSGLTSVDNTDAFTTGRERELDSELRARRERSLVGPSSSTDYGIGSSLEQINSVDYARAISDRVLNTVRCLAYPNTANQTSIAAVIWNKTPAGIELIGAQSAIVTDENGDSQPVYWDWVTELALTVVVNIAGIDNTTANKDLIKAALVARAALFAVGEDVYDAQLEATATAAGGALVTSCSVTVNGGASVVIDVDELATLILGGITVNIT